VNTTAARSPNRLSGPYPAWLPWAVLLAGAALRLFRLGDWSLWFDEETSIYFALNPHKPFPRAFPLYFWVLGRVFSVAGVSVYSARLISALAGIATLWLAWRCIRRFAGDEVALPALVLLLLSPGHLFWSQSIRYYTLLLVFQIASIHAFLTALDRRSPLWWSLTVGWLVIALLTNTTAALLVPVYVVAVAWTLAGRRIEGRVPWAAILTAVAVVALGSVALATLLKLHDQFGYQSSGRGSLLLLQFLGYAGLPAVALMLVGLAIGRQASTAFVCFALLSIVPVLELMILQRTHLWSVAWYHGLIAVIGVAAMGGYGWKALADRLPRRALVGTGVGGVGASLALVVVYFAVAHGDRPRWKEAAAVLRDHGVTAATTAVDVRSDAPGVIAYYLGVPPGETMGHQLVRRPPWTRKSGDAIGESWFVVEQRLVPSTWRQRLDRSCESRGVFPGALIVRDRTVLVYHCSSKALAD
jgi:hypothetical protein